MADDDVAGETPAEPIVEELAPAARPSCKRLRALWGSLAVLAVGAGALAINARDDDPPRLPVALGATGEEKAAAGTADMSMIAWMRYVAGEDLPDLGGDAPAYRLRGTVDPDDLARVADALGLDGTPTRRDGVWRIETADGVLEAYEGNGGSWWYSSAALSSAATDIATSSGGGASSSEGVVSEEAPVTTVVSCSSDEKCEPTAPTPPADLPSKAEARRIALELFAATGAETEGAKVTVDGPYDAWYVSIEPRFDGMVASGIYFNASIGSKGEITSAGGVLNQAERLGRYPTITTRGAIDRLNAGTAYGTGPADPLTTSARADDAGVAEPGATDTTAVVESEAVLDEGTEPAMGSGTAGSSGTADDVVLCAPAEDLAASSQTTLADPDATVSSDVPAASCPTDPVPSEPMEVVLHEAERILVLVGASDGSTDSYLVPGYRLTGDFDQMVDVPSVDDESLLPTTPRTTVPADEPTRDPAVDPANPADPDGPVTTVPATRCAQPEPGPDGAVPDICLDPNSVPPAEAGGAPGSVGEG